MAYSINGKIITDEMIEEEFDSIKDHYINLGEVVCCDRDEEFRNYARENITNRTLLEEASEEKFGETTESEVEEMFEQLKTEHGGEDNFFQNTGFNKGDETQIKRKIKSTITVDRILETHLGQDPVPTEEDLRSYYEENIDKFMTEEEIRLSQLFIEPTSHEEARTAFQDLRKLRAEILDGKIDFLKAAKEHGHTEQQSIDMGFMKQGETMPEIESITFSLRDEEVSPIVATNFGFHIFKLMERREPAPVPFEKVKEQLPDQYLANRREAKINELVDSLKAKATIEEIDDEPVETDA